MRKFIICPINDVPVGTPDNTLVSVESFLKKALKIGKQLYGDNFQLREFKNGILGDYYETCNVYNSKGEMIMRKGVRL